MASPTSLFLLIGLVFHVELLQATASDREAALPRSSLVDLLQASLQSHPPLPSYLLPSPHIDLPTHRRLDLPRVARRDSAAPPLPRIGKRVVDYPSQDALDALRIRVLAGLYDGWSVDDKDRMLFDGVRYQLDDTTQ